MARREGEIVRVRDKQLYLREDVAWTDAGHQRLEKKIAEDSVDEERRCQHTSDPPRFAEHQQHRCQRHPENTGVSQTGNKTHASIQHGAVQGLQELQESEFGVHKAPSFSFCCVQDKKRHEGMRSLHWEMQIKGAWGIPQQAAFVPLVATEALLAGTMSSMKQK